MLCYYNVHVSKNRGMFSHFPEYHWVALSMTYAFQLLHNVFSIA